MYIKFICTLKASSSVRSSPMYTGRTLVRSSNPKRSIDQTGNRQRTTPSEIREDFYSRAHAVTKRATKTAACGSMYLPSDLSKNSTALPLSHMIDGRISKTFLPSLSFSSGKSRSTALTLSANELQLCRAGKGGAVVEDDARGARAHAFMHDELTIAHHHLNKSY